MPGFVMEYLPYPSLHQHEEVGISQRKKKNLMERVNSEIEKIKKIGIAPSETDSAGTANILWDNNLDRIYFVDFSNWNSEESPAAPHLALIF